MQLCYKETQAQKMLGKLPKEQNSVSKTSYPETVFQTTSQSISSDSVFLLKLKTITTYFEHQIFYSYLKNNFYGTVSS